MAQADEINDNSNKIIRVFYSRSDSIICQRIVDALRESNFNILLNMDREENGQDQEESGQDQKQTGQDQDEKIKQVVNVRNTLKGVSVLLVLISRKYAESSICETVLTVSSMQAKPILPIIIDKDYEPVGWIGYVLAGHSYVRWHGDGKFPSFINDIKKHILELLPLDFPTASDSDILAEFDSIIALSDNSDSLKADVDRICQSICKCMQSAETKTENSETLLPIAVEIFLKYNVIMSRIDNRFVELNGQTGAEISFFLDETIKNAAKYNPFEGNQKRAREVFSRIFNSLATFPTTIYFLNDDFMLKNDSHGHILYWGARVLQLTCFRPVFNSEQDAAKFPEQQIVLQIWLKYIDKNIQMSSHSILVDRLLGILWNLSANVSLVPLFVDACFPSTVVSWLSRKIWSINGNTIFYALCMVYNFARHDKGADALNLLGTTDLLISRKHILLELTGRPDASTVFDITLALLYEPETIDDETLKIEPILKELLTKTLSTSRLPELSCGIVPFREFLLVFNTLFINEELIRRSIKQTVDGKPINMESFPNLLMDTPNLDVLARTLLLNIIYRMTSVTDLKHKLDQNQAFLDKLQDLKSQSMENIYLPKHTVKLQDAVNGILRNLGKIDRISEGKVLPRAVSRDHSTSMKKKVMVSYAHENQGFCKALVNKLKKWKFDVWVDYERLEEADGDQHEHIVEAMKTVYKIICIMTKDYFHSTPCKNELNYVLDKRDPENSLIPIRIGKKYEPPEEFYYRFRKITYIRFNEYPGFDSRNGPEDNDPSFEERIKKLRNRILHSITEKKPVKVSNRDNRQSSDIVISPTDSEENNNNEILITAPKIPLREWTKDDIVKWLASIPVTRKLTILYNFQSLEEFLAYACDLKEHEDINYIDIKEAFYSKYECPLQRKDFLILRDAFDQLMKNNPSMNDLESQALTHDEANPVKSKTCALM